MKHCIVELTSFLVVLALVGACSDDDGAGDAAAGDAGSPASGGGAATAGSSADGGAAGNADYGRGGAAGGADRGSGGAAGGSTFGSDCAKACDNSVQCRARSAGAAEGAAGAGGAAGATGAAGASTAGAAGFGGTPGDAGAGPIDPDLRACLADCDFFASVLPTEPCRAEMEALFVCMASVEPNDSNCVDGVMSYEVDCFAELERGIACGE